MSFSKKRIHNFFVYGFGQAINIVSPLFIIPYVIFICGEDGLGKIGAAFSFALILNCVVDYGSYINGVKQISINRENKQIIQRNVKAIYLSKFILLFAVACCALLIIQFIPFFEREKTVYIFSLSIVLGQFINPSWFFQGIEEFKWISLINVVSKGIYIILVFLLIKTESDYIYVNLYYGIGAIIGNLIGFYGLVRKQCFSLTKFSLSDAVLILKEEFSLTVSQFFLSVYQFFPIILISMIAGNTMAGLYRVIEQIIAVFKTYLNMFFYFIFSSVCFELEKNLKKGLLFWKQYNGFNFLLLFVMVSVFFFFSEPILLFFKINEMEINELVFDFRIALIIPLLTAFSQALRQLLFAFNQNSYYIKTTIFATIANIILLAIFTNWYGLRGVFASIIIIEIVIIFFYTKKTINHIQKQHEFKNI